MRESYIPNSTTHPAALDFRRRCVESRLKTLDEVLGAEDDETASEHIRNLAAERRTLRGMRNEIACALPHPPRRQREPKDAELGRQLRLLRGEIHQRTRQTMHFIDKMNHSGEFRQARLHSVQMLFVGEMIVSEFGLDAVLLAFCDPPKPAPVIEQESSMLFGGPVALGE